MNFTNVFKFLISSSVNILRSVEQRIVYSDCKIFLKIGYVCLALLAITVFIHFKMIEIDSFTDSLIR